VAGLANFRSRWLHLPYGDQALALRATLFRRVNGFQDWPLMEDFEFVRRAARYGRVQLLESEVRTSGRRWLSCGVLRTTLVHQACILGYWCGVAPERLARWRDGLAATSNGNPVPRKATGTTPVLCSCGKRFASTDPAIAGNGQAGERLRPFRESNDEAASASRGTRS
jgi:hypothetical protein